MITLHKAFVLFSVLGATCCVLFASPAGALAAEIRSGPSALVAPGETIDDDLFIGGAQTATIDGHVTGDAYAAADTVEVTGTIDGDLLAAAQQVIVDGTVRGNVRAAGGTVTVNGSVGRNVTAAAQHVNLSPNGRILGSIVAAGQTIEALGEIGRGMNVGGGTLQLAGPVGGPVLARVGTLSVAPSARLARSLDYQASEEATLPSGAVSGDVRFTPTPQQPAQPAPVLNGLFDLGGLIWLLGSFLLGTVALILMPRASARAVEFGVLQPWQTFGLGLALLICVPLAAMLVGVTLIGLPLALTILALYTVGLIVAWPMVALVVGTSLTRWARPDQPLPVLGILAVGLIGLHLVTHVPLLGPLVTFCALVFGLGMLAETARHWRQPTEFRRTAAPVAVAA
jgi:cytoskeletal protein CcmA (bactofilin family)